MKLRLFTCGMLCWMMGAKALAQDIKLEDIKKIELNTFGSWVEHSAHIMEVIPEAGVWKLYQLRRFEERPKLIIDSNRHYIKLVSASAIKQLLFCINKPDTVVKLNQFKISKTELKNWIDSLQTHAKAWRDAGIMRSTKLDSAAANLNSDQKNIFNKIIDNDNAVEDASFKVLNAGDRDDANLYQLIFTYKNNATDTISAYQTEWILYHFPWWIRNRKSYNPRLAELFESIRGNEKFVVGEHRQLIDRIDDELFRRWVFTKIYWEDYKKDKKANYVSLSKTLYPTYIFQDGSGGFLGSSLLPFNIQLRFGFGFTDTLKTDYFNNSEKLLVNYCRRKNFLSIYLKARPKYIAMVGGVELKVIDQVKALYSDIQKYDSRQIQLLTIWSNFYQSSSLASTASNWLILPDGRAILLGFSDALINKDDKVFGGFKHNKYNKSHQLLMIFDKDGRKIAGDESEVKIDLH